jgi:hypothetical protein
MDRSLSNSRLHTTDGSHHLPLPASDISLALLMGDEIHAIRLSNMGARLHSQLRHLACVRPPHVHHTRNVDLHLASPHEPQATFISRSTPRTIVSQPLSPNTQTYPTETLGQSDRHLDHPSLPCRSRAMAGRWLLVLQPTTSRRKRRDRGYTHRTFNPRVETFIRDLLFKISLD